MTQEKSALEAALENALKVIRYNVEHYYDRFQHVSEKDVYPKEINKVWTMGFYPGELYLAFFNTKDEYFISKRQEIIASFKERCESGHMDTHDIGFLYEMTAYYDYKATGDEQSKQLFLDAADKLMVRYNEKGGFIQAWGPMDPEAEKTRIIIDCMMNLPLLFLSSELTGDPKYKEAAISHAKVSAKTLIREDYSSYHTYWMDVQTGAPLNGATHQGNKDESTWARGQAWAVYGYYKSYAFTKDPVFLDIATKCADVYLANLPENDINYWDFDYTDENPDIRDSSATAIFVAGLIRIAKEIGGEKGEQYTKASGKLLSILAERYQNTEAYEGAGLIREGMYHRDLGTAFVSWGDYYYLDALYAFLGHPASSEDMKG